MEVAEIINKFNAFDSRTKIIFLSFFFPDQMTSDERNYCLYSINSNSLRKKLFLKYFGDGIRHSKEDTVNEYHLSECFLLSIFLCFSYL